MRPRFLSAPKTLIAAIAVVAGLAAIWGGVRSYEVAAYRNMVAQSYHDTERSAGRLASNTALTLAEIKRTMNMVKYEHERGTADLHALSKAGLLGSDDDVVVSTTDRDGHLRTSTRIADAGNATFADRPYFQQARAEPGIAFGPPTFGRISKRWVIPAALQLLDAQGRFDGVVLLAIDAGLLTRGFKHDSQADTSISVIGSDGVILSRRVGSQASSGFDLGTAKLTELLQKQGKRTDPSVSPMDNIARYPSLAPITGTDWVAVVSASAAPSLAEFAAVKRQLDGSAVAGSMFLLLIVFALLRQGERIAAAEANRRQDDALHQAVLNAIPAAIALSDPQGRIATVNAGWLKQSGAESGEADPEVIRSYVKTYQPDAATGQRIREAFANAQQGNRDYPGIEFLGASNGVRVWYRLILVPVRRASGLFVLAINFNIDERKLAEESLLRSKKLNGIAAHVARIGGWTMTAGSQQMIFSDELSEIYGLAHGSTLEVPDWIARFHPDARPAVEEGLHRCFSGGIAFDVEAEVTTAAGKVFWARALASAVRDDQNRIVEIHGAVQDATERHLAEEDVRQAQERLDTALASMTDGFCTLDDQWRFTYTNPETERLLQAPSGQLLGKPLWELLTAPALEAVKQPLCAAVARRSSVQIEDILLPSGAWCEARAYPSGVGVAIYLRDTGSQRRAQQQLRLMETCVSRMNDMVVVTEADPTDLPGPRIVFVNDALLRFTGYTREELIGKTPRVFQGPATDRDELAKMSKALRQREPVRVELINYTKAGEPYWVELDLQPVFNADGKAVQFLAVERDITQRRRDREELRTLNRDLEAVVAARTAQLAFTNASLQEREHEISSVLQNMADCIISIDHHGRIRSANESVQTLFGYETTELLGEHVSVLIDDPVLGASPLESTAVASTSAPRVAVGLRRRGDRIAVEVVCTRYSVNQQTRCTVIVRDIRERLKALAELQQARVNAEDASKTKSAFVATMSHEIRTPMNGVIGMIDVLRETRMSHDQSQMLELARESAYSLMEVVESVLDFSKIEAGKVEVEAVPMSLPAVMGKVFDLAYTIGNKRGVRMSMFVDPAIPAGVLGDAVKIRQVLLNLLSNAIKFCSGGDTTGEVDFRARLLRLSGDQASLRIEVRDNGIGMDAATLGRLFQSFTQADASTTRRFGGTGLGLIIARELTELMGGAIDVESQLGTGSTFSVKLPLRIDPGASAQTPAPCQPGDEVLILGGDASVVGDLSAYFQHCHAELTAAPSIEALGDAVSGSGPKMQPDLCVFVSALTFEEVAAIRSRTTGLSDVPWVVVLADGPREPRLVSLGVAVLRQATMTFERLHTAATMARDGGQELVVEGWLASGTPGNLPERAGVLKNVRPILVVEDNEINQRVLSAQLDLLGYSCQIADDGMAAFDRWKSGDFSLVLTDLHMPQSDGFSLVAAIRTAEAPGERIPIVALTANALKDEADRCLAAGMDGYATKPLTFDTLQELLNTWIRLYEEEPPPAGRAKDPAAAPADRMPIDVNVLASVIGDDPAVVQDFLGRFGTASLRTQATVIAACERADWIEAGDHVHQLKSSARSFGALTLGDLCESLEAACANAEVSRIEPLLADLRSEIQVLLDYLDHRSRNYVGGTTLM